jgi:hypothetical protein
VLYPLSYEGGGFESVSAWIGAPGSAVSARVPGTPGPSYTRPQGLGASLRFVYLGLIFDDKRRRDVVSLDSVEERPILTRFALSGGR